MSNFSYYFIIVLILIILIYALFTKTDAYTSFINGAKKNMFEGIKILPYLLIMYVAINVFKASSFLNDTLSFNFIPNELIVEGIFRPISSSASMSVMLDIFKTYGVDSKVGITSTILEGGSDTTIYVMGLYFGSVGIKKTRHSYIVGLLCDLLCLCLTILLFLFVI